MGMTIDLDAPSLGVTREEVEAEWKHGRGSRMEIFRRLKLRNLTLAIEQAQDFATLRKAMLRQMEFIR